MKHPTLGQAEWEIPALRGREPSRVRAPGRRARGPHQRAGADHRADRDGAAAQKGYLGRRKCGGVYQYGPKVPLAELLNRMVKSFVENTLSGVVSPFFAYLSQSVHVSDEQLGELKQLVCDLETQRKGPPP